MFADGQEEGEGERRKSRCRKNRHPHLSAHLIINSEFNIISSLVCSRPRPFFYIVTE